MLIAPRASICQGRTNLSIGTPKLHGGNSFRSGGTFHTLSHDGFALEFEVGHGVLGEGDAGRNVLQVAGGWRVDGEEGRIRMLASCASACPLYGCLWPPGCVWMSWMDLMLQHACETRQRAYETL